MKPRTTLSIGLVLSVVLALLMSFDLTATAQNQLRPIADTGVITGTTPTQGNKPKVTVVRRVNQARLSAAQIKSIRSLPLLGGVLAVRGTTITTLASNSMWQLSNGAYLVVAGNTEEPLASQVYSRTFENGDLMVWACYCPGYDANKDDGCKFDGPASAVSCSGGVNCTCKFEDFLITTDGAVIGFEGPRGD